MAYSLNLSPSRFHYLFKSEMGTSPTQYLRAIRLREAKSLLESTFLSVKQVMIRVGIGDGSHFARDFKHAYGLTPQQLKRMPRE
jgi:transcriptional regulator GlxA family with amidase domain